MKFLIILLILPLNSYGAFCANGDAIKTNTALAGEIECFTPSAGGDNYAYKNSNSSGYTNPTSSTTLDMTNAATTFVTNASGNPVEIVTNGIMKIAADTVGEGDVLAECILKVYRDAAQVEQFNCKFGGRTASGGNYNATCAISTIFDSVPATATSYDYTFKLTNSIPVYDLNTCQLTTDYGQLKIVIRQAP